MQLGTPLTALCAAAFVTLAAPPASAQTATTGTLTVSDLWTRATPPGAPTAGGYLTVANSGNEADRLIAVSTPAAAMSELHRMEMANGVMTMRPVQDGIEVPPGGTVTLAPGGLHIMFMALANDLTEGGTVPVVLTFEKVGTVEATMRVMALGATGPAAGSGQ